MDMVGNLETLLAGGKLEKAVNYTFNHKETLMNYLLDGRSGSKE